MLEPEPIDDQVQALDVLDAQAARREITATGHEVHCPDQVGTDPARRGQTHREDREDGCVPKPDIPAAGTRPAVEETSA